MVTGAVAGRAEQEVVPAAEDRNAGLLELGAADFDKADVGLHLAGQQWIVTGRQAAGAHVGGGPALDKHHALAWGTGTGGPDHQAGGAGRHAGEQEGFVAGGLDVRDLGVAHRQAGDGHRRLQLLLQAFADLQHCGQRCQARTACHRRSQGLGAEQRAKAQGQQCGEQWHGTTAHVVHPCSIREFVE